MIACKRFVQKSQLHKPPVILGARCAKPGDGKDTIGVFRAGLFLLRNTNTAGLPEITLTLGLTGGLPVAGKWAEQP